MDLSKIFLKDACPTKMGGQAVMEGIMMKGEKKTALAVRLPNGDIQVKTTPTRAYGKWMKIPLLRGVVAFIDSLVTGTKTLMDSAEMLEDGDEEEYEESRFEAWLNNKFGAKGAWNLMIYFSVFLALVFTVGIFIILPTGVVNLMKLFTGSVFWLNFAEGAFRILLFVAYVWLISLMGEIKRVFQYHGAEHKTIHCFENGLELTPANCRQFPTLHPRCGTSFLMFVFIIAFALHFLLGWPSLWLRILSRLLLLPVIAGLSYELLKWAGKSDNIVVKILSLPGLYLQKITTKEPDDSQLEVAIAAIHAVCDERPCGTFTICKEDVGHYDGHELIESAKNAADGSQSPEVSGVQNGNAAASWQAGIPGKASGFPAESLDDPGRQAAFRRGQVLSCKAPAGGKRGRQMARTRVIFVKRQPLQGRRFI